MAFDEIPEEVDRIGDDEGWDDATRARVTGKMQRAQRERLTGRSAHVTYAPFRCPLSLRERIGGVPPTPKPGVTIRDEQGGAEYDVVLDERGRPTYYAVRALDGALTGVDEWPRDQVALLARLHLADSERDVIHTEPREQARRANPTRDGRPRHEYIAELIREAEAAGLSPRLVVARQTGRKMPTVDRWLREARAADPTLPQATRDPRTNTKGTER